MKSKLILTGLIKMLSGVVLLGKAPDLLGKRLNSREQEAYQK